MDKLKMHTEDIADKNFDILSKMFPNAVTETIDENGEVVRTIDADVLRQEISGKVIEGKEERYQFSWPDKRKAILKANSPSNRTLRLEREKSVGKNGTIGDIDSENVYIEGDNLDALKLLRETYLGKIKLIYIDPPYNTGNDFVYNDYFAQSSNDYLSNSGQFDENGNRLVQNTESNGRFHTDWLNMIYPRLKIAKDLLSDDGIICVSIDNNEVGNLRKVCNEIFGESNLVAEIVVQNNPRGRQSDRFVATVHEYLLCYAKNSELCAINGMPLTEDQKAEYSMSDEKGAYRLLGLRQRGVASLREDRPDMFFPIYVNPTTLEVSLEEQDGWNKVIPKKSDGREGRWMWGKQKCIDDGGRLVARMIERRGEFDIFVKDYLDRGENEQRTRKYRTIWDDKSINNQVGTQEVKRLLGGDYMSFPKSSDYIQMVTRFGSADECIVLDFFSGSATTAQAVMQLNAEDGGQRKFIMVQLPELTYTAKTEKYVNESGEETERYIFDDKTGHPEVLKDSAARKAGYYTITDIGEKRIIESAKEIKNKIGKDIDYGFRVFKIDSSNMKDVFYNPADTQQTIMDILSDNIKEDRTPEDLLFQVMLDLGVLLSSKIEEIEIAGKKVFDVADGFLIACFDKDITEETVTAIAQKKPYYAVFRDGSMANDSVATNFDQLFETYSPDTVRKVL